MNMPELRTRSAGQPASRPAWYGTVMGTGTTSVLFYVTYEPVEWPVLLWGAIALPWIASALTAIL